MGEIDPRGTRERARTDAQAEMMERLERIEQQLARLKWRIAREMLNEDL